MQDFAAIDFETANSPPVVAMIYQTIITPWLTQKPAPPSHWRYYNN